VLVLDYRAADDGRQTCRTVFDTRSLAARPCITKNQARGMMGGMTKRRFSDLSPRSRTVLVALGAVQISLNVAAQVDLSRRSASEVRGSKIGWRLMSPINLFGPLAYFRWGRLHEQDRGK